MVDDVDKEEIEALRARVDEAEATAAKERARNVRLETKVRELEEATRQLQLCVEQAREGAALLKTIAKIRQTDVPGGSRAIGFDAIASKVDRITQRVNEIERSTQRRQALASHGSKASGSKK